jgi:hypothetical protein
VGGNAQTPCEWWSFSSRAEPQRAFPMMNPGRHHSHGPNGANMGRSHRFSGGTERDVSGERSDWSLAAGK